MGVGLMKGGGRLGGFEQGFNSIRGGGRGDMRKLQRTRSRFELIGRHGEIICVAADAKDGGLVGAPHALATVRQIDLTSC